MAIWHLLSDNDLPDSGKFTAISKRQTATSCRRTTNLWLTYDWKAFNLANTFRFSDRHADNSGRRSPPLPMLRYDFLTDRNQNNHWKGHRPKGPTHSGLLHSLSRKILRITERTPVPILKNAAGAALKCGARLSKMWRASRFHVVCTTFYPAVIPWISTRSDLFIQELST